MRLENVLLASAGKPIPAAAVERVVELATRSGSRPAVHVVSVARIWGTALGLQHPGLYPTKREWAEQRDIVEAAVRALKRRGFEARGHVVGSRSPSRVIAKEARRAGCQAIVFGSPTVPWWLRFQDDAWLLARRSPVPVHFVPLDPKPPPTRSGTARADG